MANSLQGVNLAAIAQKSLDTLLPRLPMITGVMSTDFSSEVAVEGASITTRVATKTTAQDFNATTADQDATTTAKTITLSNYKGTRIAFTDSEWSKSSINLEDVFIKPAINGIANSILSAAIDVMTAADLQLQCLEADFDAEKAATIARQLTAADVPYEGRFLLLDPGFYLSLAKDPAVQAAYAYGSPDVIRENLIPRVHGFSVWETNSIPQSYDSRGFAGHAQTVLLATRLPAVPANFPGDVETVTDPESGFSLQFRRWYSPDDRKHRMEVGVIYGVANGTNGLLKIGNFE